MLELYASSTAADTAFEITLSEEINFEQITSKLTLPSFLMDAIKSTPNIAESTSLIRVSSGSLKASMRELDKDDSESYHPQYIFSSSLPLTPSRTTRMDIAMQAIAHRFRAGSRIILTISQVDDDSLAESNRQDSIFHNQQNPSRVWLPVISGKLETIDIAKTLSVIPIDLQSELISNPASEFRFDTEFSNELDSGDITDSLQQVIDNPVLFINPEGSIYLQ